MTKSINGEYIIRHGLTDGRFVRLEDYNALKAENAILAVENDSHRIESQHTDLFKSVVEKFFNSSDLKNRPDAESCCALAEKLNQLPDCILDFTEEQVRDNPAWALAVFRHKVKEMQYKRIHDLNEIGMLQESVEAWRDAGKPMADWLDKCGYTWPDEQGNYCGHSDEYRRLEGKQS